MLYIFLAYIALCLVGANFKSIKTFNKDLLSKETTNAINGIFVGIILFSHFNSYLTFTNPTDLIYLKIIRKIGQLMVTTFFFYSGYGILESIKNKKDYMKHFFKNRILKLFIIFGFAVVLWIIYDLLTHADYTVKDYIVAFTGLKSIGNSSWFIFATFWLYIFTLIGFNVFKKKEDILKGILLTTIGSLLYISYMKYHFDGYWYNTVLCFNLGMFISYYKEKIIAHFKDNTVYSLTFLALLFILWFCFQSMNYLLQFLVYSTTFSFVVFLCSYKINVGNRMLKYLGDNTFNIYIMQRMSYISLQKLGLLDYNIYLYFAASIVLTIVIVFVFDKMLKFILKRIYN